MNETKNTPRLQKILAILGTKEYASRENLATVLSTVYPVSKPTLARDLKYLLTSGQIQTRGAGRSTSYFIPSTHPLLKQVNLSSYFELDPDQRPNTQKQFNSEIFTQLSNLFTPEESKDLESIYRPIPKNPNIRELERFVIELSWKSSKIEGNTYTLLETESLIKDAKNAPNKSARDATMILNHKSAFETILSNPEGFTSLNSSAVLQLHNKLIFGLGVPTGIRTVRVGISGTAYIPPDNQWLLTEYFDSTLKCINHLSDPLEKALISSAMIAYLQPFADGNKRTARMLTNAILIAHNHYPLSYRSVDENEYKQALILFFETNNLYHLKRLFIEQYRFALTTYSL
jgi:Fic family protein